MKPPSLPLMPGDILLLCGNSKLRGPNLIWQSVARRSIARFSHVAIAYSTHSIVDANPNSGIKIRPWSKAKHGYLFEKSLIYRHTTILESDALLAKFYGRVAFYLTQPYSLTSFIRKRGARLSDREGITCSQFVAAVFDEIGLPLTDRPIRKTFPEDIVKYLQKTPSWQKVAATGNPLVQSEGLPDKSLGEAHEKIDEALSKFTQQQIAVSRFASKLDTIANVVRRAAETGSIQVESVLGLMRALDPEDKWSPIQTWRIAFMEPMAKAEALFLHELDRKPLDTKVTCLEYCNSAKHFAEATYPELESRLLEQIQKLFKLGETIIEGGCQPENVKAYKNLCKITNGFLTGFISNFDSVMPAHHLDQVEGRLSNYQILVKEVVDSEIQEGEKALHALSGLWTLDIQHRSWIEMRTKLLEFAAALEQHAK